MLKRWRRFRTKLYYWAFQYYTQGPEHLPSVQAALASFEPSVLKDINHYQTTNLYVHAFAPNVTTSCAILKQVALDLRTQRRISNTLTEMASQVVPSSRYFLDSKGNYTDYSAILSESVSALAAILTYAAENSNSKADIAVANCRAIEFQLPDFYRYLDSLLQITMTGPLRK